MSKTALESAEKVQEARKASEGMSGASDTPSLTSGPENAPTKKRGPGRPRGLGKVPGSGRKPGTPNKITRDIRNYILQRGKPLELLFAVSAGRAIKAGLPDGKTAKVYPTLSERMRAATALLDRAVPALKATELSGTDGKDLIPEAASDMEFARRLAFVLGLGGIPVAGGSDSAQAADGSDAPPGGATPPQASPHSDVQFSENFPEESPKEFVPNDDPPLLGFERRFAGPEACVIRVVPPARDGLPPMYTLFGRAGALATGRWQDVVKAAKRRMGDPLPKFEDVPERKLAAVLRPDEVGDGRVVVNRRGRR